jgi:hypothetical protein
MNIQHSEISIQKFGFVRLMKAKSSHVWKFFRVGGVDQVTFRNGADLTHLAELDQKLWMTLAIPTRGIEFDPRTADLIDTDKDDRIRPPEVLAALHWVEGALKDPGDLLHGGDSVALAAIKDPTLLAGAQRILHSLKKSGALTISLADASDTVKIFDETNFNGDGVIIVASADNPADQQAITDIIATLGPVTDRSGKPGIDQARLDQFFTEARTLSDWAAKGEADRTLTPLGLDGTTRAALAVKTAQIKVDDYFGRCRLAAYDEHALPALNPEEKDYLALASQNLSITAQEVANLPLAKVAANQPLLLASAVNPAWAAALATLSADAITPLLGPGQSTLTEADWAALQAKLAAFEDWLAGKPITALDPLGLPRLRELIASGTQGRLAALIQQDAALEGEFNQFAAVEKLLRFQKDLYKLLTNFVNFADFYGRTWAVFQAGTLYLDNRACNLCIGVTDPARHAELAYLSGAFLAYCDLARPGDAKRQIVAIVTDGDCDNLIVGRNGVFYDRSGQDWDATISKIVANPISIRQGFWSPYKKISRLIEAQIAKRAAALDATAQQKIAAQAQATVDLEKNPPPAPPSNKIDPGTLAALGLVLTTLLGAVGTWVSTIFGKPWWEIPLIIIGMGLAISLPSMGMAAVKLRKRNLGPILDANGWAINNAAKMNIPFGRSLTELPQLPPGSERSLTDPFAEKKNPWWLYVLLGAALGLSVIFYTLVWPNREALLRPYFPPTQGVDKMAPAQMGKPVSPAHS